MDRICFKQKPKIAALKATDGRICFFCERADGDLHHFQSKYQNARSFFYPGFGHLLPVKQNNKSSAQFCHDRCRACCCCGRKFNRGINDRRIQSKSGNGFVCRGCTLKGNGFGKRKQKKLPPQKKQKTLTKHGSASASAAAAAATANNIVIDNNDHDDEERFCLEYPGEDRNAQTGFKGVKEIKEANFGTLFEARVGTHLLGVFGTAEEAARARDMSLVVRAYRKRKAGDKSNDPARTNGLNFPESVIASLCCDTCSQSFDCLGGIFGLIQHQDEGICGKIFDATEEYAEANCSADRAAAVQNLNASFQLPQSRIEEGWVLNEDPSQRVRLRRFFEHAQNGDGSVLGTAVAVLLHPLDGFLALMLHDDGDMEDLNRDEFDQAKRNYYDEKGWLDPLDPTTMEYMTSQDGMSLGQIAVDISARYGIADADITAKMLLRWNAFVGGEKLMRNARLKEGTTVWFRNPASESVVQSSIISLCNSKGCGGRSGAKSKSVPAPPDETLPIRAYPVTTPAARSSIPEMFNGKRIHPRMREALGNPIPRGSSCFFCDRTGGDIYYMCRPMYLSSFFITRKRAELIPAKYYVYRTSGVVASCLNCRSCASCGNFFSRNTISKMIMSKSENSSGYVCVACTNRKGLKQPGIIRTQHLVNN